MVDDDRDWLRQLEGVVQVVRTVGMALVAVLLLAAIFTIASVIRLTAYLYRDEIGVMRLVGATELFIRGPFYVEGLVQGRARRRARGGRALPRAACCSRRTRRATWLAGALTGSFLPPLQQAMLVGAGRRPASRRRGVAAARRGLAGGALPPPGRRPERSARSGGEQLLDAGEEALGLVRPSAAEIVFSSARIRSRMASTPRPASNSARDSR